MDGYKQAYDKHVMPTYSRLPISLVKGKGADVWDSEGKKYLDFFPGWAVSGLGHCHPRVVQAVRKQAGKIIHVSNNFYNQLQGELADKIIEHSFEGKVFFCNSGAEANEGAFKLARKWGNPREKLEIISMENSFHGRTLATLAATGQFKYQDGFWPLPDGFKHVPFNDISAVKAAIMDKTVAILIEPIQGEGGINEASLDFIKQVRQICDEKGILLIFDEVQTGMGRTGKWFAYQHYGIEPDIMTLAKSLGGGLPIGATVAKKKYADTLQPGSHASTFGGSPVVCSAALAVFDAIESEELLENTEKMSEYIRKRLEDLKKKYPVIAQIKGKGLMIGIELTREGGTIVNKCLEEGLLINCTQEKILRLMPPLGVKKKQINKALKILENCLQ